MVQAGSSDGPTRNGAIEGCMEGGSLEHSVIKLT